MIIVHLRDHWLSVLVMINHWKRRHGLAPDEWYWADLELIGKGRNWMPCYWSLFRFRGLLFRLSCDVRILYLLAKVKLLRWWWKI